MADINFIFENTVNVYQSSMALGLAGSAASAIFGYYSSQLQQQNLAEMLRDQVDRFSQIVQQAFETHHLIETSIAFDTVLTQTSALSHYVNNSETWYDDTTNLERLANVDQSSANLMAHATALGLSGLKCFVECATLRLLTLATYLKIPGSDDLDLEVCQSEAKTYRKHYLDMRDEITTYVSSDFAPHYWVDGAELGGQADFTVYSAKVFQKVKAYEANFETVKAFIKQACLDTKPTGLNWASQIGVGELGETAGAAANYYPITAFLRIQGSTSQQFEHRKTLAMNRAKEWRKRARDVVFREYMGKNIFRNRNKTVQKWEHDFNITD